MTYTTSAAATYPRNLNRAGRWAGAKAVPMKQYVKVDQNHLMDLARRSPIRTGIELLVMRMTHGYQRQTWKTSVSEVARYLDRYRQNVSPVLAELVEQGVLLRVEAKGENRFWLALANRSHDEPLKPVENVPQGLEGVSPGADTCVSMAWDSCLSTSQDEPVSSESDTDEPGVPVVNEAQPTPKDKTRTKDKNKRQNFVKESDPAVENRSADKPQETHELKQIRDALDNMDNVDKKEPIPFKPTPKKAEPIEVSQIKLTGFPTRPEVSLAQRMELKEFWNIWGARHGSNPDHTRLKSYLWQSFERDDLMYLLNQIQRADRNLIGYANRVIRNRFS